MGTAEVLAALARAHDADTWVEIGWVDDDGAPQSRLMRVLSLSPGVAHLVRRAAGRISLPLARIVAVGPGGGDGAPVTSSSAGS